MWLSILGLLAPLLDKILPDTDARAAAKEKLGEMVMNGEIQQMITAADIVKNESASQHWLTATWRPALMWVAVLIIANQYLVRPFMWAFGVHWPDLELDDHIWSLLNIGLGGYIVGRSAEKVADTFKNGGYRVRRDEA